MFSYKVIMKMSFVQQLTAIAGILVNVSYRLRFVSSIIFSESPKNVVDALVQNTDRMTAASFERVIRDFISGMFSFKVIMEMSIV